MLRKPADLNLSFTITNKADVDTPSDDVKKSIHAAKEKHLEAAQEQNEQALKFMERHPGASVRVESSFTGLSMSLFNKQAVKDFLEKAKQDENARQAALPYKSSCTQDL